MCVFSGEIDREREREGEREREREICLPQTISSPRQIPQ